MSGKNHWAYSNTTGQVAYATYLAAKQTNLDSETTTVNEPNF